MHPVIHPSSPSSSPLSILSPLTSIIQPPFWPPGSHLNKLPPWSRPRFIHATLSIHNPLSVEQIAEESTYRSSHQTHMLNTETYEGTHNKWACY